MLYTESDKVESEFISSKSPLYSLKLFPSPFSGTIIELYLEFITGPL